MADIDLSVELFGIKFRSPLWLASGPWGNTGEKLRFIAQKGRPGAVVNKTLTSSLRKQPSPRVARIIPGTQFTGTEYSGPFTADEWFESQMPVALQGEVPLIVSMEEFSYEPEGWVNLARRVEAAGAAVIELGMAAPAIGSGPQPGTRLFLDGKAGIIAGAVKRAVSIPVMVKIPYLYPGLHVQKYVSELVAAGVDGIVTVGSSGAACIDIEHGRPGLGTTGRLGNMYGAATKACSVAIVQEICSSFNIVVIGTGGIRRAEDVIEYFMAGASAVELMTEVILRGPEIFTRLEDGIKKWLSDHGYSSLGDIKGKALKYLGKENTELYIAVVDEESCNGCRMCEPVCSSVSYELTPAIRVDDDGKARVDKAKCQGCGWCQAVCAPGAICLEGYAEGL